MSKEIKILPELRFPEYKSEEEWGERNLGEIGEFVGGGTPSTSNAEYWNGDILWYTPTEVKNGVLNPSIRTITQEGLQNSSAKLLPVGTILITTRATIGDAAIANKECTTNQGFQSLIVKESEHNQFWYYWIIYHKHELERRSSGSTFKEIGKTEIQIVPTLSPKKEEQQKIASCLSSLDELISAHNEKLEALKDHKKGLLQNLFPNSLNHDSKGLKDIHDFGSEKKSSNQANPKNHGSDNVPKLRFPEFEDDGEWVEKNLGDVGEFIGGGTPSTSKSEYWNGEILWYTPTEVKNGVLEPSIRTITKDGVKNSSAKLLPKGTILITTRATIGDAAIANKECATNQGFQSLFVKDSEHNQFWYYWVIQHKHELERRSSGSTFKEIGKTEIKVIPTLSPKKDEQQKIASCLSAVDELITAQQEKIDQLQQHKKGLMQGLFPKIER